MAQRRPLTALCITFSPFYPIIFIGGEKGHLASFKLSPNLRRVQKENRDGEPIDKRKVELSKLEKVLATIRVYYAWSFQSIFSLVIPEYIMLGHSPSSLQPENEPEVMIELSSKVRRPKTTLVLYNFTSGYFEDVVEDEPLLDLLTLCSTVTLKKDLDKALDRYRLQWSDSEG
ncbi:Dynein intermediate chain 2, ciliary [Chionoecetes opilio]|uniref:Dynein intermediate chain 2, ciliary n=1 Tax=Chionoecetes opilio TaxID=41210 RepID=A0A8J4XQ17_CHIOP|nr:Dynein intermediate chain 2, ciliary [Chionoecetes opilio]